ncbi:MAG TPA: biotin--[acetyl-CoA-carboxylase] ligase [Aquaticitalea sp.]|nr:biotin--[acetyl-CoA-carboxylase] ligase [Aquaticitalea sp.]
MHIIKLNAIDSTNSFLKRISNDGPLEDMTVVVADYQTDGRGQMGTQWVSKDSNNLLFSVFKKITGLDVDAAFSVAIVVALSVFNTLVKLQLMNVRIKWPNDILSGNKKLAGILIENVVKQNRVQASVIGIGININQVHFEDLPNASSLILETGRLFDRDEVLQMVLLELQAYFQILESGKSSYLKQLYEANLFRKDKPSTFTDAGGTKFSGFIRGITESGNLKIEIEDAQIKEYDLKSVSLLY